MEYERAIRIGGRGVKMTNFEKYKEEILTLNKKGLLFGVVNGEPRSCMNIKDCEGCQFNPYPDREFTLENCIGATIKWLYQEPKIKLTKSEKTFCEMINDGSRYLTRDSDGTLSVYNAIPRKEKLYWDFDGIMNPITLNSNMDLFSFIKWEDDKPWNIEDLLKLEVEE
jgi:hypothetical protein